MLSAYTRTHLQASTQPKAQTTYRLHGDFDKQIDSSGHRHSALGRRTAEQIRLAFILGIGAALQPQQQIFSLLSSSLFSLPCSSEACPCSCREGLAPSVHSQKPHSVAPTPHPSPPGATCYLVGPYLSLRENEM